MDPTITHNEATDTDTVTPKVDLKVTKTNGTVSTTGADNTTYAEVATFDPPTTGSYTIAVPRKIRLSP